MDYDKLNEITKKVWLDETLKYVKEGSVLTKLLPKPPPLTKWEKFKRKITRPFREAKYRISYAIEALKGNYLDDDY